MFHEECTNQRRCCTCKRHERGNNMLKRSIFYLYIIDYILRAVKTKTAKKPVSSRLYLLLSSLEVFGGYKH
jgi:hypothetical protein